MIAIHAKTQSAHRKKYIKDVFQLVLAVIFMLFHAQLGLKHFWVAVISNKLKSSQNGHKNSLMYFLTENLLEQHCSVYNRWSRFLMIRNKDISL